MKFDSTIYVKGLSHQYGSAQVLDGAELTLSAGELYGLLGRNGAGKSTAIRAMCGFLRPDEGVIRVAGCDVTKDPLSVRRHIGVVSEDVAVYEKLTAREFLGFAAQMHGLAAADARNRSRDLLKLLELDFAADRSIVSYSLGMKKKPRLPPR